LRSCCGEEPGYVVGTVDRSQRGAGLPSTVGVEGHILRKQREEGLQVAAEACLQEALHQAFLLLRGALEAGPPGRHGLPGAA
jgi:hypothetical protein